MVMGESVYSLSLQKEVPDARRGAAAQRRSGRMVRSRMRALECVQGILEGKTYQQVADDLGYASRGTVHRIVQSTLAQHEVETIEELRALELARLDALQSSFFDAAVSGDVAAAEVVLKILAQRFRVLQLHRVSALNAESVTSIVVGGSKEEFMAALQEGREVCASPRSAGCTRRTSV